MKTKTITFVLQSPSWMHIDDEILKTDVEEAIRDLLVMDGYEDVELQEVVDIQ